MSPEFGSTCAIFPIDDVTLEYLRLTGREGAQIALVGTLHDLAAAGAHVLCATHSPLLAALPGARILEIGPWGVREAAWEELELVAHWRRYLEHPMRYLRHVIDPE